MRCFHHSETDAVATCVNCGKALCSQCVRHARTERIVCSEACETADFKTERSLFLIRKKTALHNTVSAVFLLLAGAVFGLFGLYHVFFAASYFFPLAVFTFVLSIVFFVAGAWYLKGGKELK